MRFEKCIFGANLLVVVVVVDSAGKTDQYQLSRLQNEFHGRLGGSANPRRSLVLSEM